MQDINGYERFIGLLPGCYSMGVSHPETFVAGANLVLNSAEAPLTALTVYGHSTQDGTPSPDNPVPIVSAGDEGEINVSVSDGGTQSQTLALSTPGGLPGIPVTSGGNYTDESGQQWVCDEIDLARGKYVQRVGHNANVNDWVRMPGKPAIESTTSRFALNIENIDNYKYSPCICNRLSYAKVDSWGTEGTYITINETSSKRIFARIEGITSLEDFRAAMPDLEVIWLLETPIETDLPAEEIAAYKAMHTYSPTTTVSNDAGAWMKVGYYGLTTIQKLEKEALLINGGKT